MSGHQHAAPPRALTADEATVQEWIHRLAKWLPEQRPLSVFVHSNPLEAFESHHFHAVCEAATRILGRAI